MIKEAITFCILKFAHTNSDKLNNIFIKQETMPILIFSFGGLFMRLADFSTFWRTLFQPENSLEVYHNYIQNCDSNSNSNCNCISNCNINSNS